MVENICEECGKPFKTEDEDQNICNNCWEKLVNLEFEGEESRN